MKINYSIKPGFFFLLLFLFQKNIFAQANLQGTYYLTNSENSPNTKSYYAFISNGTYQENHDVLSGAQMHLKGRYEVNKNHNRIYLFNQIGKTDTLNFLNGHIIYGDQIYVKGNPALAQNLNSELMMSANEKDAKALFNFYDSLKQEAKKHAITYETPYGDINPGADNDKALQDLNSSSFKSLGLKPSIEAIRNDWNKVPIEMKGDNLEVSETSGDVDVQIDDSAALDGFIKKKIESGELDSGKAMQIKARLRKMWNQDLTEDQLKKDNIREKAMSRNAFFVDRKSQIENGWYDTYSQNKMFDLLVEDLKANYYDSIQFQELKKTYLKKRKINIITPEDWNTTLRSKVLAAFEGTVKKDQKNYPPGYSECLIEKMDYKILSEINYNVTDEEIISADRKCREQLKKHN